MRWDEIGWWLCGMGWDEMGGIGWDITDRRSHDLLGTMASSGPDGGTDQTALIGRDTLWPGTAVAKSGGLGTVMGVQGRATLTQRTPHCNRARSVYRTCKTSSMRYRAPDTSDSITIKYTATKGNSPETQGCPLGHTSYSHPAVNTTQL